LNEILLLSAIALLLYASWYDIKYKKIKAESIILILCIGLLYYSFVSNDILLLLSIELLVTFIFIIPTFLGMGWGDMYLLWSLGFMFSSIDGFKIFLIFFIISAGIWTFIYIDRYGLWYRKPDMLTFEYPFVPAIAIGFILYFVTTLLF